MLSRRSFLWWSSMGAACSTAIGAFGRSETERGETLPPAVASLVSMKEEARPITAEERRGRIEQARKRMAENKIDAVMLTGGTSLDYFSNIRWDLSERLFAMVLPAKGEPFYVCPAFEEDRAREQIASGPHGGSADVRTWEEHENPFQRIAQGLKDRGISTGRLGMEETVRYVFSAGVSRAAPGCRMVSATPVTAGCRMIKDAHEQELMRLASRATMKAIVAVHAALKEGMSREEVARLIAAAHERLGFESTSLVMVGKYSAMPHGSTEPQTVREGTILLIDCGCVVEGYHSDISRTLVLGKPTDNMQKIFEIEQRAQTAALKAAKPGVPCEAVDAAARKVIVDAGYGPDYKYFTHRVGHGIGMDEHEWPYLVRGNKLPLEPGMTFSDEPGIYIQGEFGVRLEDDMVITANGAELLTPQSQSLGGGLGD